MSSLTVNGMEYLSPEYKTAHCVRCGKLLSEHRQYTQADIDALRNATFDRPINGHYAPVSPLCIGQWMNHDPMPWPPPHDGINCG